MRIALDVDSTLADTWGAVLNRTDDFDDVPEDSWLEDRDLWDEYLEISQNVWHNHSEEIERHELFTHMATKMLAEYGHTVDVVTARSGVEEQMFEWLLDNRVVFNDFLSGEHDKHELDYHVYIDDSVSLARNLPDEKTQMMPVRNYNLHVANSGKENIYPLRHLRHAAFLLTNPPFLSRHI